MLVSLSKVFHTTSKIGGVGDVRWRWDENVQDGKNLGYPFPLGVNNSIWSSVKCICCAIFFSISMNYFSCSIVFVDQSYYMTRRVCQVKDWLTQKKVRDVGESFSRIISIANLQEMYRDRRREIGLNLA